LDKEIGFDIADDLYTREEISTYTNNLYERLIKMKEEE